MHGRLYEKNLSIRKSQTLQLVCRKRSMGGYQHLKHIVLLLFNSLLLDRINNADLIVLIS